MPSSIASMGSDAVLRTGSPKIRICRSVTGIFRGSGPPRGQTLDDECSEGPRGMARDGAQLPEGDGGARSELWVVRDAHDFAHPGLEVCFDLIEPHHVSTVRCGVQHDDGLLHELLVAVLLKPGQGL